MAVRNRSFDQFGPYLLFKKLESDALTDLWRAGRIEDDGIGATVALRRFHAGDREALVNAARAAKAAVPMLTGTSFAKSQAIDVIENTPFIAHDYAGGRSLQHIVERARGGAGITPNPIPIDLAVVIAEKVALSLATMAELRYAGERMVHGALLPQFVWISDDGEIRVAGQMLGSGIVASLRDAKVGAEMGRYFPPEYQSSGTASQASEIYALGAVLYLVVTGHEPPDPVSGSAFMQTIRSAKTMGGAPIPNDIRAIIEKSLVIDPKARYATVGDMKQELSALVHSGKYPATTFNLAFYLNNLLKKELEGEAIDRDKEAKVNVAAYAPPVAPATPPPTFESAQQPAKRFPLAAAVAAIAAVAVLGAGAYFMFGMKPQAEAKPMPVAKVTAPAPQPAAPKSAPLIPEPIVVQSPAAAAAGAPPTSTTDEEAARKKAFEAAVKQRLDQEMLKLQTQYTRELQQKQSKNAPVQTASLVTPQVVQTQQTADDRGSLSAAQLDQQRLTARETEPRPVAQETAAPVTQTQQAVVPQPLATAVHEGDIIDITEVDTAPKPLVEIRPTPSPIAVRQHVQGSVVVTVFVSEQGDVLDAKVLSGIGKFGIDDAAIRAARGGRFTPATKDGKRVKTWMPLRFDFKL